MNPKNRTLAIIGAVVAVVVLVAGLAVFARGGDDDSEPPAPVTDGSSPTTLPVIGEVLPVKIFGDPLPPFTAPQGDPAVGTAGPVVEGQSFDGTPLTLGGANDGPSLLVFLAHWCPHCNDEIPELNQLRDAGSLPSELDVIGIATGTRDDAPNYPPSEWMVEKDWTWPVMADDEESTALAFYGGTSFPFLALLDAEGKVVARMSGSSTAAEIQAWVEANLAALPADADA